jgi:hypothetical protein
MSQYLLIYHQMNDVDANVELGAGFPGDMVERLASEHFKYDLDLIPLRIKARCDGKLIWNQQLTNNNNVKVGPAVVLASR